VRLDLDEIWEFILPTAAKERNISVMLGPTVIQKLSLDEIAALPKDRDRVPSLISGLRIRVIYDNGLEAGKLTSASAPATR
jgi:hypothetical protein